MKKHLLKVDISIVQMPAYVTFECPNCNEDIEISYDVFCDEIGEHS